MNAAAAGPADFVGVTWQAEARARLYGVGIGVRVAEAGHLPVFARHLPHGVVLDAGGSVDRMYSVLRCEGGQAPAFHLYGGARRIAVRADLEWLARAFAARVRHFIAARAQQCIFIHAGAVGWRGRAVVIPGRTLTGKTRLVAELVLAGAVYYSDEYAVLDERGMVHPFAKPLSMRTGAGRPQELIAVEALGGRAGTIPLRIGAVLSTRYEPGAEWRPDVLSPGGAALALFDNAVAARSRFREVSDAVSAGLDSGVRAWQGIRGDARPVARWVLEQMAAART